jgi:hypothetical protein
MKSLTLGLVVAAALSYAQAKPSPAMFDPVGKWTYSTQDDAGAPVSGTMEIAGKPGVYTGTIGTGPDRMLQIQDIMTSPHGMVVFANLPDGGAAVIKIWTGADGKLLAGWGPIRNVIPATVARVPR